MPHDPESKPRRAGNKRGHKTRVELVEAAWRLVDRMSLIEMLSGLTPTAVAREAGKTTGAMHHHFGSTEDLVRAMVEFLIANQPMAELEALVEALGPATESPFADMLRTAALVDWEVLETDEMLQHMVREQLIENRATQTRFVDGTELREIVAEELFRRPIEDLTAIYDVFLESVDRTIVPPLDMMSFARVLSGLTQVLHLHALLQPGEVDGELFAAIVAALVSTFTTPSGRPSSLVDLELGLLGSLDVNGRGGDRLHAVAHVAATLFDDGVSDVTLSQIASRTEVPARELAEMFGTVRRVAAVGFSDCLPEVIASANRHRDSDPKRALADVLCDIARAARARPHLALALLEERIDAASSPGPSTLDIRLLVPLAFAVLTPLGDLHIERQNLPDLAALLIDTVLLLGATRVNVAPASVAEMAIRLLPASVSSS